MVPLSMALSDLWPSFQGHGIFEVTITQEEKCLTYEMVLCLVTLTDL